MTEPVQPVTPPAPDKPAGGEPAPTAPAAGAPDLKTITGDQLAAVLENPELWKTPRMKELLANNSELKKLKSEQEAANEKSLTEQKKFEDLANQRGEKLTTAEKRIQTMTIDQALTNVLVKEGVIDLDGALKLADRSKLSVDDNGTVSGTAETLAALKTDKAYLFNNSNSGTPTVGGATNPGNGGNAPSGPAKFKVSQLKDLAFYNANRKEILAAQAAGLIEDDTR